ncbi:MAG: hypothetical protein AB1716_12050 [Planctomycetota bacterium]
MRTIMRRRGLVLVACAAVVAVGGCPIRLGEDALEDAEIRIGGAIAPVQVVDPRSATLPVEFGGEGEAIVVDAEVGLVTDISTDVIVEEVPDLLLLGFENLTGTDIYLEYLVDGEFQAVFVFDGETLLLDYFCAEEVVLITEEHFDPVTGVLIEFFEFEEVFLLGFDYECGDALIFTFTPIEILVEPFPLIL